MHCAGFAYLAGSDDLASTRAILCTWAPSTNKPCSRDHYWGTNGSTDSWIAVGHNHGFIQPTKDAD